LKVFIATEEASLLVDLILFHFQCRCRCGFRLELGLVELVDELSLRALQGPLLLLKGFNLKLDFLFLVETIAAFVESCLITFYDIFFESFVLEPSRVESRRKMPAFLRRDLRLVLPRAGFCFSGFSLGALLFHRGVLLLTKLLSATTFVLPLFLLLSVLALELLAPLLGGVSGFLGLVRFLFERIHPICKLSGLPLLLVPLHLPRCGLLQPPPLLLQNCLLRGMIRRLPLSFGCFCRPGRRSDLLVESLQTLFFGPQIRLPSLFIPQFGRMLQFQSTFHLKHVVPLVSNRVAHLSCLFVRASLRGLSFPFGFLAASFLILKCLFG